MWNSQFVKYLYHYGSEFLKKDFVIIIILVYDEPYFCLNPLLQNAGVVHYSPHSIQFNGLMNSLYSH